MSTAAGSLARDMLLAFRDQQLSDITVMAFGQTFHLHRLILLRSGYFRSLILGQAEWIEKSRQAITIKFDDPFVTLQSFLRVVHWLYGIDFHFSEGCAPITFQTTDPQASTAATTIRSGAGGSDGSGAGGGAAPGALRSVDVGRHGLGLIQGGEDNERPTYSQKASVRSTSQHHYDNIMMDPSDKIDELLISMYAAASYLNITMLMDEICSDIALRIKDNRGLIHYMEYAWKLNNGKAWDIILAQCFYQFFWNTCKSMALQEMLVSPDMPQAGLVKTLVAESLWVQNEYERYQLVKGIMLRRLSLDTEKLMGWVFEYHEQDWFMVLKDVDDNGIWSYELSPDEFLSNLLDWESTSTAEYEDAVDTDNEWTSTTKELRRRSSQVSTTLLFEEDRTATPTAESTSATMAATEPSNQGDQRTHELAQLEENAEGSDERHDKTEKRTSPQSPLLGTPLSSPALSAISITSDTLPRHQIRDLLIFMYILHHSINYTHMSFDNLHQILTDGLVLPARVKDAFWRQHLLRRIAVSTSPTLPYLTAPSAPLYGRYHGAEPTNQERTPLTPGMSRAKMSGSSHPSPAPVHSVPINSHGLLPIRFSTSLYISRRDLMTDGKHFTSSTFYAGSWWSIQVGNYLNSDGQVGVFLSSAPAPRVVPNAAGSRSHGATYPRRGTPVSFFGALRGDQLAPAGASQGDHDTNASNQPSTETGGANGDCSSAYSRQRELTCSYRVYMTTNVAEPLQYFTATANARLEKVRRREFSQQHPSSIHSNSNDAFRPRVIAGSSSPTIGSPDILPGTFTQRPTANKIASEDELVCDGEGDLFKLNDGWGYKKSEYLTRVARLVRDQPSRASQSSVYPSENAHGSVWPRRGLAHGPAPQPAPQHQQQQQHPGQPIQGQHPIPPPFQPGQQQAVPAPAQQQPQPHLQLHHPQPQPHTVHAQAGNAAQTQNSAQSPHNLSRQPSSSATASQSVGGDDTEDDGLWIYFVVKVGWSDRKKGSS
ncbi:hypothetical protein BG011_003570 [Mortierella polycephala]|uniref:BTB domain-containing protein n=1 Tax=Mortierella polycephala TaxID=41804 RepID=A0A9P6Q2Q6_9FUNG|nr:hypothetical protein BG011_003570 [Mortierella polycephala]